MSSILHRCAMAKGESVDPLCVKIIGTTGSANMVLPVVFTGKDPDIRIVKQLG